MKYFVYILQCSDGSYYIGSTNNIEKRVYAHNNLQIGAKYTRYRRPVQLQYSEECETHGDAIRRELSLKKLSKEKKKKLVESSSQKIAA